MGKINKDFLEYIFDVYPELESIQLEFGDQEIEFSDVNYLLPYLAFTNSLDEDSRLINVFHPPFSDHHKIIPFYITLAVFKKEVDKMRGTLQPIENDLIVLNNGSICRLKKIDLKNERILFKYGTSTGYLSFEEFKSPLVRPGNNQEEKYAEIKELVEEYQLIHSNSLKKLLDTPKYVKSGYESGVIVFTNKSKFRTLFNNLKVSGLSINTRIPAVDAVYGRNTHQYRYDYLNNSEYSVLAGGYNARPFILIASYLDIENIDTFQNKYPHLDTIIFDEAENKLNDIEKVIGDVKKKLKSDDEGSLRDVYLLTSDSSLHTYYDLNRWEGDLPFHWISTPKDMSDREDKRHNVHLVDEGVKFDLFDELENLKREIRKLYKLINYEEINPLYEALKKIVIRYYSIFDQQNFHSSLEDLVVHFDTFSQKNLDKEFDKELINNFRNIIDQLLDIETSKKLQYLAEKKDEFAFQDIEQIGIVSRNKNANDQRKLLDWFSQFDVKIEFLDFDQPLKTIKERSFDSLLFLEIRKPYINSLFIHDFPGRIYLLLTKYEYNFYRRSFYRVTKILNWITTGTKRGKLLNIDRQVSDKFIQDGDLYKSDIGNYVVNKKLLEIDREVGDFDESFSEEEKDLLYEKSEREIEHLIIQSIENKTGSYQGDINGSAKGAYRGDDVLIIFEDRTLVKVRPEKKYYKVIDEDVADINDLVIRADLIKKGDDLLLFHIDHDDLLELLLNKIRLSDRFKSVYELSEKWRDNAKALCNAVGYKRASELLAEHIERNPGTLENWCEGNTLAPHQHRKVITGLNRIAVKYEFKEMEFLSEVDSIKDASSKIKGLLFSLPRKLKERSVRKLYDLNTETKGEDRDEALLINQILNDVDIKTVSFVMKTNSN